MYTKLIEEMKENVPNNLTFSIGYFEGQKHSKISIVSNEDLKSMYSLYPKGEILLWCDGRGEEGPSKRKRKRAESACHDADFGPE